MHSLVRVTRRVRSIGFPTDNFTSIRDPFGLLFIFLSRYFFAIGFLLYLAFDDRYHQIHFALPSKATQPFKLLATGLSPSMGLISMSFAIVLLQHSLHCLP